MFNDPVFANHKRGAVGEPVSSVQNAVFFADLPLKITEQRKGDANLFSESMIGGNAIDADSENLGTGIFEFGDIRLIRLQLLRSARSESKNIESEHHVLFAQKLAERNRLTVLVWQGEVRSPVAHVQCRGGGGKRERKQHPQSSDHYR